MKAIYFFLISLLLISCKSIRDNKSDDEALIVYESEPCYGSCKVFICRINYDKTIEFEGFKNVEKIGNHKTKIFTNDFTKIKRLVSKIDFEKINSVYTSKKTDLHLRKLFVNYNHNNKNIILFDNIPIELRNIENEIFRLIKKYNFE